MLLDTVDKGLRMWISGHVQGVGFRHFIWRRARELGLRGEVRNLPGGAVQVRAFGEAAALDRLLAMARQGPSSARVTEVRTEADPGGDLPPDFEIGN